MIRWLYIVPAEGGQARRMRCNTELMNSWHSFSPNSRWLVFSSKSRSPYTQMFLTHLDNEGNDSPAILIENVTAANRAVNIPEFVNIPSDGLSKIEVPAAEFYRLFDRAWTLAEKGQYDASIAAWEKALEISPDDAKAHNNLGRALAGKGQFDEAMKHWQRAVEINPGYAEAHNNIGVACIRKARYDQAVAHFQRAMKVYPFNAELHNNLASAFSGKGKFNKAIAHWQKALAINPKYTEAYNDLGTGLFSKGRLDEAIVQWQKALESKPDFIQARYNLGRALARKGKPDEAIVQWQKAIAINPDFVQAYFSMGDVFYRQGKIPEALSQWTKGMGLEPNHLPVLNQAAWVLATCSEASIRRGAEAVRFAERAYQLSDGKQPEILDTLAAAYSEAGRFQEAVQVARRALILAVQENKSQLAEALKARISLYETNTPFRETKPMPASPPSRP